MNLITKALIFFAVIGIILFIVNKVEKYLNSYNNIELPDGTVVKRKKVKWKGSARKSFREYFNM